MIIIINRTKKDRKDGKKKTVRIFQATNERNLTRENLFMSMKGKL